MMYFDSAAGWGWFPMIAMMVVLLGLATLAVIVIDRHTTGSAAPIRTDEASRILAERFARGEIDQSEYDDRLSRLRSHGQR